ncbi:MAG: hypothetical protein JSS24_12535 [Proteobacteria bacterium]|nr:hypothetical protein [Pseudomonadota bacterium]
MRHLPRPVHPPKRLRRRYRRWIYVIGLGLWGSGVAWMIAHHLLKAAGSDPLLPAASEPWWLRVHGATAMAFLVTLGSLFPVHVRQGWHAHLNRASGVTLLTTCAVLTVTGYGLYYLSGDAWRAKTSIIHQVVGVAAVAALLVHVILGRRVDRVLRGARHTHHPGH